jgi:large conductance mechanosensitive channel
MAKDDELLKELKRIRKLLEEKEEEEAKEPKNMVEEFIEFVKEYKVMGLAVAFIIGLYIADMVQALVNDLVMPLINLVIPNIEWEMIQIGVFRIGHFIGALIEFIIVAFVVFILVKATKRVGVE